MDVSRTKLGIFSLRKCIYFPEDFVTIKVLSFLRRLLTNRRVKLLGQGGDGEHCCTIKALKPFPSLWHAPSQAARACLQHSGPWDSCTKCVCTQHQTLNLAEGFHSLRLNLTGKSESSVGATSIHTFVWERKTHSLIPPIRSPPIIFNMKATSRLFCTLLASKQTALIPRECHLNLRRFYS